ncbi:lipase family protein [Vibrio sp. B1FLJ16]|uniref:lipase family protein n=1 Tax=Vibrio sp. B1FLJ16 TaxID=2751178 RepID=UPI0015F62D3F|nr:lipase family protein [Vibrio sp. B1FLJ16]CAD7796729.1 Lipase (class 3) [Vibrio sp. B1FLJ16]CAE6879045.1 Lipase (class 3) [Vibrio sp. B1FLJ16]
MNALSPKSALDFAATAYDIEFNPERFRPTPRLNKHFVFNRDKLKINGQTGSSFKSRTSGFVLTAEGKSKNKHDSSLVLAFRGTNFGYAADVLTDLHADLKGSPNGSLAHAGFINVLDSLKNQISQYLSNSIGKIKVIHCVGHSLGGAIASICADWLRTKYKVQVFLYTFGAPRVGLKPYAIKSSHSNVKIFRCTNGADPVPMIPLWPFTHAPIDKPEYRLDNSYGINFTMHKLHSETGYFKTLKSDNWEHLNKVSSKTLSRPERLQFHNRNQVTFSQRWSDKIASAIITLLKDAGYASLVTAQGLAIAGMSFYDLIARALEKVCKSSKKLAEQTKGLLGHMLVFAGKVVKEITDLSYKFIKWVFDITVARLYRAARLAISS